MGLPDLPFHLRLDPLSGFFLTVIGSLGFIVSIYSIGYVKGFIEHGPVTSLAIFYSLFLAGMFMVVLADDAFFFLISWEVMAAASYFLVMFEDERTENRRAAFLYLVIAHIGAIAILLSFGLMAGFATGFENFNGYTFDAMRHAAFPPHWAALTFFLAFFGFAAKAGVIPLHVWLPEAHPVAPSNVSALMSGIMLKTAIYGIIRVTFDLIRDFPWWWGAVVLILGLVSALLGILFALQQQDLKKLLAYSSAVRHPFYSLSQVCRHALSHRPCDQEYGDRLKEDIQCNASAETGSGCWRLRMQRRDLRRKLRLPWRYRKGPPGRCLYQRLSAQPSSFAQEHPQRYQLNGFG